MQRLFWLGSPYFYSALATHGWTQSAHHDFDNFQVFGWDDIVRVAGFEPDVLVLGDKSMPPLALGVEDFPCLTVLYAVDSHIHSWLPAYAQAFDVCLVSLRDHLESFAGPFLTRDRIFWSPPFARDDARPGEAVPKQWDCLFAGTVSENTPGRASFLKRLGARLPGLHVCQGDYRQLFPRGRVLLNYCEAGDLNFRVFEAMGMGGCLVTPRVGHGQDRLFVDGEQLVEYVPDDVGDALFRIGLLLEDPDLCAHIGAQALAAVDAGHRATHRAAAFTDHLCDLWTHGLDGIVQARLARAQEIRAASLKIPYLHWAEALEDAKLKRAYLEAAAGGSK